ncbi:MAG: serine/threonine-protein kinase [Pseudomonadota bacterium]
MTDRDENSPGEPPDREARALALFAESLELASSLRFSWLAERCAGDTELLAEILRLSDADRSAQDDFLRSPLDAVPPTPQRVGDRLGAFEIVAEIGAGGMGRVFEARRVAGGFAQAVAVKLFEARLTSPDARARFEAEREILASLEHPGIARVIDGGTTEDDVPYLVMELVRGQRIVDFCRGHALDLDARLQLFQRVCAAVELAHERGIVHRDLKPGNVLVTHAGDPKLIDFGIAKVLDAEALDVALPQTRTQAQLLTPEYASPEQVRGEAVTAASDVYSLGVLLYELLVGSRPYHFPSLAPAEIERTVCDSVPSNPSDLVARRQSSPPAGLNDARELQRALRGDLDRIVMTALRKEPGGRYPTAAAFAEDIGRYLGGFPVRARGASGAYRLGKFVQRHRAASVAVAATLGILVAALVLVSQQANVARDQRDLAQREAGRATAAKDFLVELIGRSDPFENAESATLAGALRQSVPGMAERFDGQPELEAEMRYAIGYALQNLGEIPLAREQLERALALREAQGSALDRAEVLDGLGIVNWWESEFDRGEERFAEAVALLAGEGGERAELLRANVWTNLAGLRADAGAFAESLAASDAALAAAEGTAIGAETLATIWGNRANALGSLEGRELDSIASFEKALELQAEATGEMHPNYAIILNNLAFTHYGLGNLEEVNRLFERSLEIRRATLGPEHPQTATALFNLAAGQVAAGAYDRAEPNALEALKVARNGYAAGHPRIGKAHEKLAQVYQATARPELARSHAEQALAIYEAAPGVDPAWVATVEGILAALAEAP